MKQRKNNEGDVCGPANQRFAKPISELVRDPLEHLEIQSLCALSNEKLPDFMNPLDKRGERRTNKQ